MTGVVRPEAANERSVVRRVVGRAFGDDSVPDLVDALRESWAWVDGLSLVAPLDDDVIGHVLVTRAILDAPDRLVDVLVLSPLSVVPEHQRQGVGSALVHGAVERSEAYGSPLLFLEGDPAFYRRCGFEAAGPLGFRRPSTRIPVDAFQVRRLATYSAELAGTLVYPDVFWRLDCVGLRD